MNGLEERALPALREFVDCCLEGDRLARRAGHESRPFERELGHSPVARGRTGKEGAKVSARVHERWTCARPDPVAISMT